MDDHGDLMHCLTLSGDAMATSHSVLEPSAVADRQPRDIQSEFFAATVIPTGGQTSFARHG